MRKSLRLGWILAVVLGLVWVLPLKADETKEPTTEKTEKAFRAEHANLKIGKIPAGQDAVGKFIFHNDTDHDIKIIRAKPS